MAHVAYSYWDSSDVYTNGVNYFHYPYEMNYYPVPHDAVPPRDIFEGPEQDHLSIGFTGYDTPEEQLVQPCSSWENLSPQRSDPISPSDSDSETTFSPIKITGDELVLVKEIAIDSSEQRELNPQEKAKILDKLYPSDDQYRQALRGVLQSLWYQKGTLEPQGELSDFIARRGQRNFACTSCHREYKRADRAIAHFRTHIEHRPFKCAKALGCGDKSCNMAFFTNDCLKSHCRKQEKTCKRCGTTLEEKNMNRHLETQKCGGKTATKKRYHPYR